MGLMDRVREQAAQLAQKTQEAAQEGRVMLDQAQARRRADAMFRDLGAAVYAERTGRGGPDGAAKIDRLVKALSRQEAEQGLGDSSSSPSGQDSSDPPPSGQKGGDPPASGQKGSDPPPSGQKGSDPPPSGQKGSDPPPSGQKGSDPPPSAKQSSSPPPSGQKGSDPPPSAKQSSPAAVRPGLSGPDVPFSRNWATRWGWPARSDWLTRRDWPPRRDRPARPCR